MCFIVWLRTCGPTLSAQCGSIVQQLYMSMCISLVVGLQDDDDDDDGGS